MRTVLFLSLGFLFVAIDVNAQPASEKLFKQMIVNLPNYKSQPGTNYSIVFNQFNMASPTNWTMEYGKNKAHDKNTKVYKVIAGFTLFTETYNTQSGQKYSSSSKKYRRLYHFYIDRTKNWVCTPLGLSSGHF